MSDKSNPNEEIQARAYLLAKVNSYSDPDQCWRPQGYQRRFADFVSSVENILSRYKYFQMP